MGNPARPVNSRFVVRWQRYRTCGFEKRSDLIIGTNRTKQAKIHRPFSFVNAGFKGMQEYIYFKLHYLFSTLRENLCLRFSTCFAHLSSHFLVLFVYTRSSIFWAFGLVTKTTTTTTKITKRAPPIESPIIKELEFWVEVVAGEVEAKLLFKSALA